MKIDEIKQQATTVDRNQLASIKGGSGDSVSIIIIEDIDTI